MRISDWSSDVCSSDLADLKIGTRQRRDEDGVAAHAPIVVLAQMLIDSVAGIGDDDQLVTVARLRRPQHLFLARISLARLQRPGLAVGADQRSLPGARQIVVYGNGA